MKNKVITFKFILLIFLIVLIVIPCSYGIFKKKQNGITQTDLATWTVTLNESEEPNYLSILPDPDGTEASYDINITSQAEVDIVYTIIIDNLPSETSVSLDNGTYVKEENHKVIFSDVSIIAYNANTKTKTHMLTFKASSSAGYVDDQEVNITVIARQSL